MTRMTVSVLFGALDDIRVYNRALGPTEVGQLYVSESPTGCNLLVNGGFENSPIYNQRVTTLNPEVDGWSSSIGAHMGIGNLTENNSPQQGVRQALFNNGEQSPSASIQQEVSLSTGSWYRLSYWTCLVGGSADSVPGSSALKASIVQGGVATSQLAFAPSPSGTWIRKVILFQASTAQATVKFEDASTGTISRDIALDSVELVQINPDDSTDSDGDGFIDIIEYSYGSDGGNTDSTPNSKRNQGSIRLWGWNNDGQLNVPSSVSNNVIQLAVGRYQTIVLTKNGEVVAWGLKTNNMGKPLCQTYPSHVFLLWLEAGTPLLLWVTDGLLPGEIILLVKQRSLQICLSLLPSPLANTTAWLCIRTELSVFGAGMDKVSQTFRQP